MESHFDELKLEVDSRCEQMARYATSMASSLRISFNTQIFKLPRSIRNMDIKTFAETYKGQIFAALRQEVNKKQKELDSWVRATPRLKKNAIDETKQIRRKYNLRSSARKAVRRSARIANKQKSRLKVPPRKAPPRARKPRGTPMVQRQTRTRRTRNTARKRNPRRSARKTRSRDLTSDKSTKKSGSSGSVSIPEQNDENKDTSNASDFPIEFLTRAGKMDPSKIKHLNAAERRRMKAKLESYMAGLSNMMEAIAED